MIIYDFDVASLSISPHEAHAPLIVDANAVLPLPVSGQGLQAISGRDLQVAQLRRGIDHAQLSPRHIRKTLEFLDPVSGIQAGSLIALK